MDIQKNICCLKCKKICCPKCDALSIKGCGKVGGLGVFGGYIGISNDCTNVAVLHKITNSLPLNKALPDNGKNIKKDYLIIDAIYYFILFSSDLY